MLHHIATFAYLQMAMDQTVWPRTEVNCFCTMIENKKQQKH